MTPLEIILLLALTLVTFFCAATSNEWYSFDDLKHFWQFHQCHNFIDNLDSSGLDAAEVF